MATMLVTQHFQINNNSTNGRIYCTERDGVKDNGEFSDLLVQIYNTDNAIVLSEIDIPLPINNNNFNCIVRHQPRFEKQGQCQTIIFNFSPAYGKSFEHEVLKFSSTSSARGPHLQHDHSTIQATPSADIVPSISEASFDFFPKLPLELQFRIWQLAARQPHIIGINDLENKDGLCGTSARCQLMLTCKQARQEAIREKQDWNKTHTPLQPKIWVNFAVDTLWLNIRRVDFYDHSLPPLWQKVMSGPYQNICKLAVSYSVFKRRWDHMNAMVFKLNLEQLILVVDAEEIMPDDYAVYTRPRSAVERRAQVWKDWEGVTRSEIRQLKDGLEAAKYAYNRNIRSKSLFHLVLTFQS